MSAAESIERSGPDLTLSRADVDFGAGFYVTTRKEKAVDWARMVATKQAEQPALICWTHAYNSFNLWPKVAFADAGRSARDFWEFVRLNRTLQQPHRSPPDLWFDMVFGPVSRRYSRRLAVEDLDQLSIHTETGVEWLSSGLCEVFDVAP